MGDLDGAVAVGIRLDHLKHPDRRTDKPSQFAQFQVKLSRSTSTQLRYACSFNCVITPLKFYFDVIVKTPSQTASGGQTRRCLTPVEYKAERGNHRAEWPERSGRRQRLHPSGPLCNAPTPCETGGSVPPRNFRLPCGPRAHKS